MKELLMYDYQANLLEELEKNQGKVVISTPRQTGKSVFGQIVHQWNEMLESEKIPVKTIDRELVDDDMWYTVEVRKEVAAWIRQQNKDSWHEHNGYRSVKYLFDVSGKLYTMMSLKW